MASKPSPEGCAGTNLIKNGRKDRKQGGEEEETVCAKIQRQVWGSARTETMIISNHPATMWHKLQNAFNQITSPLLGYSMRAHEDSGHACKIWYEFGEKSYTLHWITAQRSGVLATPGQCSLGGEHADTWPMQAQLWSFFYLWLPDRWWLAVPSLSPDGAGIFRLWFYIKAYIWMKGNRLSNQKGPFLPWQAKECKKYGVGKAKPLDLR